MSKGFREHTGNVLSNELDQEFGQKKTACWPPNLGSEPLVGGGGFVIECEAGVRFPASTHLQSTNSPKKRSTETHQTRQMEYQLENSETGSAWVLRN